MSKKPGLSIITSRSGKITVEGPDGEKKEFTDMKEAERYAERTYDGVRYANSTPFANGQAKALTEIMNRAKASGVRLGNTKPVEGGLVWVWDNQNTKTQVVVEKVDEVGFWGIDKKGNRAQYSFSRIAN